MLDAFMHTVCGPNCLATTQQSMPGNDDNLHNASPNTIYTTVPSLPPPPHKTAQHNVHYHPSTSRVTLENSSNGLTSLAVPCSPPTDPDMSSFGVNIPGVAVPITLAEPA